MNILIFAGKIVAGTKVLILIFYQKLPSETISYNIINIFTSQWMGDRPFYRFVVRTSVRIISVAKCDRTSNLFDPGS
ncbi:MULTISPECIES: hypothetical protein [unclassified Microcoleus]|uniref:hypothetical protein n=1 Tax=unclassified Microcoleus TaxID=2642155 RepID=UPI0025D343D4|nr:MULTISPECIES: hypothetical protein [unclassified Microcoleus]